MKLSKIIWSLTLSSAIAAGMASLVCAEDVSPISSNADLANAVYSESSLKDPLSPGVRVIAYEKPMIISGISGENIQFSAEAFNSYSGYVPSSVTIVSLPDSSSGTLMYNSEPVSAGQSVSVLTLSSLYFEPKDATEAEFNITTDNINVTRCVIRQKADKNNPPSGKDSGAVTTWTKMNASMTGYLSGSDPDGDLVTFEVASYPSKGIVSISDSADGKFVYHPYEGMSGSDSFTYRVCDSFGEYSPEYTVQISIDRSKADVYDDMQESYYTAAANDAVKSGIMQTRKTADGEYFDPDEPVSRIDFLVMTMKAMGAGKTEPAETTSFADDASLTDEEKGYLSAAYRLGIVKGSLTDGMLAFRPDDGITGAEAAVIINGILGLPEDDSVSASAMSDSVPTWAIPSISALTGVGIIDKYTSPAEEILSREDTAVILTRLMRSLA